MTRMWCVDPILMCDQHLVGEYSELHMLVGTFKNHPHGLAILEGHAEKGNIETDRLQKRHAELVKELKYRGHNHDSPLDEYTGPTLGSVDVDANRQDLRTRCDDCRAKMEQRGMRV